MPSTASPLHTVQLDPLARGRALTALPDPWRPLRDVAAPEAPSIHAVAVTWPGEGIGIIVTRDAPGERCILGTWSLMFGGLGVALDELRVTRDPHDQQIHIRVAYTATYNEPAGDPGAEEHGAVELRTDGTEVAIERREGYFDSE